MDTTIASLIAAFIAVGSAAFTAIEVYLSRQRSKRRHAREMARIATHNAYLATLEERIKNIQETNTVNNEYIKALQARRNASAHNAPVAFENEAGEVQEFNLDPESEVSIGQFLEAMRKGERQPA